MADRNAADMELDERDGLLNNDHRGRKLPSILRERGNSLRGLGVHALHTFVVVFFSVTFMKALDCPLVRKRIR
jgi:hypothetical protein